MKPCRKCGDPIDFVGLPNGRWKVVNPDGSNHSDTCGNVMKAHAKLKEIERENASPWPKCNKCGLPITFQKLPSGKYMPVNVDGSSHFELCKETRWNNDALYREKVMRSIAEEKPAVTVGKLFTTAYNGDIPPWDESLA